MIKRKEESGITLIALIITIIVLLILAGVSISLVVGENGIISRATNAREKTNKAEAKERIELEVSGSYDDTGTINLDDLNKNLRENLSGVQLDGKALSDSNKIENLPTIVQYKGYDIKIGEKGEVTIGESTSSGSTTPTPPSSEIEELESYYGKKVNYSANGVTDWKIFYNNGKNIFLITSEYLPVGKVPAEAGMSTTGTYQAFWSQVPATLDETNRQDELFMATGYTLNENNSNSKCVSKLLDTNNWSVFVNPDVAEYAIGGPTIEMFIESWNTKYPSDKIKCQPSASAKSSEGYGYKVDFVTGNYSDSHIVDADMEEKDGYLNDTLYYPQKTDYHGCTAYWMASPSIDNEIGLLGVHFAGDISSYGYYGQVRGLRPVVCLQSGVQLTETSDGSGVYNISK